MNNKKRPSKKEKKEAEKKMKKMKKQNGVVVNSFTWSKPQQVKKDKKRERSFCTKIREFASYHQGKGIFHIIFLFSPSFVKRTKTT